MVESILPIFVLIGLGYLLRRYGVMAEQDAYRLVDLILYVTFPATLFLGLISADIPKGVWLLPLWSAVAIGASIACTWSLSRLIQLDRPSTGALMTSSAFGNTGFLGVPLCYAALGSTGRLSAIFYDLFGVSLLLYTVGFGILATYGGQKFSWSSILGFFRSPLFFAAIAGFAVRALSPWWQAEFGEPWLLARIFMGGIERLAPLTAPLSMIALGINLRFRAVREFAPLVAISCLAKIVLMPAVVLALVSWIGPAGIPGKAAILEAGMPSGLVAGVICGRYNCNARLGAAITVGTTLASMITLSFWSSLLR